MPEFNPDAYLAKHGQDFMPEEYLAAFGEAATTPFTGAGEKISNFIPEPINPPTSSPLSMLQSAAHGVGSLIGGAVGHLTPADLAFGAAGAGDAMLARRAVGGAAAGGPAQIGMDTTRGGAVAPRTNPNWEYGAQRPPVAGEIGQPPGAPQIEMEGPWAEGVAKVNRAWEMPGPPPKRIGADGRPQIGLRDTYGTEWPMPGPDYPKLPFQPRPDLSPVFKAKMAEVGNSDPVAALKNMTPVDQWPAVEAEARRIIQEAGPDGREQAQAQLQEMVNTVAGVTEEEGGTKGGR